MNRKTKTIILLTGVLASAWIISQTLGGPTVPSDRSPTSVRETQDGPEGTRVVRLEDEERREREQRERWERERRRRAGVPWRGLVHRPSAPGKSAERVEMMLGIVRQIERVCFEPTTAGLIAAGGLKDEVPRRPAEIIDDLEEQLARTKTLGLRNAIRLSLKDLYKVEGRREMVLKHLRAMLAENDDALREHEPQVKRRER